MTDKSTNKKTVRPPVVVVMGHIDHGKSTLLDYIRKANVVDNEAGGITQHVGAYQASWFSADGKNHEITFLDTPGHAAFCNIRERGAQSADIAILIVSAEDGVKPQTIEAYKNIKSTGMPFLVAITKIDKPNADVEKVKQSLGENEIYVEGWGGDVPCLPISAMTGEGIKELLEMIVLMAEMANLETDPSSPAEGIVIESTLDNRKGISATLLIKNGTLETGNFVLAEDSFSPVRFIEDFKGEKIEKGVASMPVKILGWTKLPNCGASFKTVKTKKMAEQMVESFLETEVRHPKSVNLKTKDEPLNNQTDIDSTPKVTIPLIIKADVIGSLEGVKHELNKIHHDNVNLNIIAEGIGEINENDVKMAISDQNTIILGFNVKPDKKTAIMISRSAQPILVKTFSVIYDLSKYVDDFAITKIPKVYAEEVSGSAKILAIFSKEREKQIVGGKVETGTINNGSDVRIMRRNNEIGRGKLKELQSKKVKVSEVNEGYEFGMLLESKIEVAPGDRIESVKTVEVKQN